MPPDRFDSGALGVVLQQGLQMRMLMVDALDMLTKEQVCVCVCLCKSECVCLCVCKCVCVCVCVC
jgi:hypothetical protein